jgi:hypothetical protein
MKTYKIKKDNKLVETIYNLYDSCMTMVGNIVEINIKNEVFEKYLEFTFKNNIEKIEDEIDKILLNKVLYLCEECKGVPYMGTSSSIKINKLCKCKSYNIEKLRKCKLFSIENNNNIRVDYNNKIEDKEYFKYLESIIKHSIFKNDYKIVSSIFENIRNMNEKKLYIIIANYYNF